MYIYTTQCLLRLLDIYIFHLNTWIRWRCIYGVYLTKDVSNLVHAELTTPTPTSPPLTSPPPLRTPPPASKLLLCPSHPSQPLSECTAMTSCCGSKTPAEVLHTAPTLHGMGLLQCMPAASYIALLYSKVFSNVRRVCCLEERHIIPVLWQRHIFALPRLGVVTKFPLHDS